MKAQLEIIIFFNKDNILYSNFIRIVFIEITYLSFFVYFSKQNSGLQLLYYSVASTEF